MIIYRQNMVLISNTLKKTPQHAMESIKLKTKSVLLHFMSIDYFNIFYLISHKDYVHERA